MLAAALTLIAFLSATLSGMTGIGGGTILIAALYALGLAPTVAVPLHAGVQLVSNFSRTLAYLRHVNWPAFRAFLAGVVPAPFLVAPLIVRADEDWLRVGMGLFILATLWTRWLKAIRLQNRAGMVLAGVLAGGLGAVVGASGTVIAPFYLRDDWSRETTIATLAVCQAVAHLLKILAFGAVGFGILGHWQLLLPMAVAVVAGTLLGQWLSRLISEERFDNLFRGLLALLALKLLYDGAAGLI